MHTSDNSDDRFEAARRRLLEVEAAMVQALATARASIAELEEENRTLRREALERRTDFFTEKQFAELLKVSESTIARLRKARRIEPLMVGDCIRYSSLHLEHIHDILGRRRSLPLRRGLRAVGETGNGAGATGLARGMDHVR